MIMEKEKKQNWLNIAFICASILWGVAGILCIIPAGIVILFFDSPSPDWNANYFFIDSVISFPIVCIGSSLAILFLKNKYNKFAFCVSLLPVLPLILVFAASTWMNLSTCGKFDCSIPSMQEQAHTTNASECAFPAPDGGDSLGTTGCGVLKVGVIVTGITSNTTEAHNWQFSAQHGTRITITIESGESCPQISVHDSSGSVIESFEDDNNAHICPSGMTTTSYFYFDPPTNGTYILRLITTETPGAYWLKIK